MAAYFMYALLVSPAFFKKDILRKLGTGINQTTGVYQRP